MKNYIEFKDVSKTYDMGEITIKANDKINFSIDKGEFVVIVGQSGAGKTTTLNILGGMDSPTSGEIYVAGNKISDYSEMDLTTYRRNEIGFIFQFYNLIYTLTVRENVELALEISKDPIDPDVVLKEVGLLESADKFPAQISGGEQQKASIARAIAKRPKLLLCDEPTGALDMEAGRGILQLLYDTCKKTDTTVILITHNKEFTKVADKVISMRSGKIKDVVINETPLSINDIEW